MKKFKEKTTKTKKQNTNKTKKEVFFIVIGRNFYKSYFHHPQ